MADNTRLNPGSGGDDIASDDIGGIKFQRVKLIHGADGTNDGDVSSANPLPASASGDIAHDAADSGNPVKIGHKAVEFNTDPPTVSADDDRVDSIATPQGIPWTIGGHPNVITREYVATSAQTNDLISAAVPGGSQLILLSIEALVSNEAGADVQVRIGFGLAVLPTEPVDGAFVDGMALSHPGLRPGAIYQRGNGGTAIAVGADAMELRITNSNPAPGKLTVLANYYVSSL